MSYAKLSELMQDTVDALVRMGVSRAVAEAEMHGVEWAAVNDMAEAHRDQQLLDLCARYETADVAKRFGVSPRTIRERRTNALNRQSNRHIAAA